LTVVLESESTVPLPASFTILWLRPQLASGESKVKSQKNRLLTSATAVLVTSRIVLVSCVSYLAARPVNIANGGKIVWLYH
jgi:hypothetical protein